MRPAYRILADRRDVTAAIRDRLLALTVTDVAGYQSDTLSLRLDDRDGKIELPRKGAALEVWLGYDERELAGVGRYTVDEIELSGPPDTLTVQAKAADMRATLKQHKTRAWPNTTIQDIVHTIAQEHGPGASRQPHAGRDPSPSHRPDRGIRSALSDAAGQTI